MRHFQRSQLMTVSMCPAEVAAMLFEGSISKAHTISLIQTCSKQLPFLELCALAGFLVSKTEEVSGSAWLFCFKHWSSFMGTIAVYGKGRALVTGTGLQTELGEINSVERVASGRAKRVLKTFSV